MSTVSQRLTIKDMVGRTFISCKRVGEEIQFVDNGYFAWTFCHHQDCCESVRIESIVGDLADLVGSPLLVAEESTSSEGPTPPGRFEDSHTWTFYKFATVKGWVDIRWYGESNGYYSERVDLDVYPVKPASAEGVSQ